MSDARGAASWDAERPQPEGNTAEARARADAWLANISGGGVLAGSSVIASEMARDVLALLAECGRLREQLDAARQGLKHYADQDNWRCSHRWRTGQAAGYVFWQYDSRDKEPWTAARAALGVEGEQEEAVTSFDLGDVTYTIEPGRVVSMWPDGKTVAGDFQYRAEDIARGRALGYQGSDREVCEQLHAEHDLAHHLVAQALGWPSSVVLRMAAEGATRFPVGVYATEERLAMLVARVSNVGLRAVAGDGQP